MTAATKTLIERTPSSVVFLVPVPFINFLLAGGLIQNAGPNSQKAIIEYHDALPSWAEMPKEEEFREKFQAATGKAFNQAAIDHFHSLLSYKFLLQNLPASYVGIHHFLKELLAPPLPQTPAAITARLEAIRQRLGIFDRFTRSIPPSTNRKGEEKGNGQKINTLKNTPFKTILSSFQTLLTEVRKHSADLTLRKKCSITCILLLMINDHERREKAGSAEELYREYDQLMLGLGLDCDFALVDVKRELLTWHRHFLPHLPRSGKADLGNSVLISDIGEQLVKRLGVPELRQLARLSFIKYLSQAVRPYFNVCGQTQVKAPAAKIATPLPGPGAPPRPKALKINISKSRG
ncbi:MAG: hypothetical protein AB7G80_09555 [Dongiaceae bacterium]